MKTLIAFLILATPAAAANYSTGGQVVWTPNGAYQQSNIPGMLVPLVPSFQANQPAPSYAPPLSRYSGDRVYRRANVYSGTHSTGWNHRHGI
ncbi:MAG TPA: hypothetical protein VHV55_14635 [Pirellulales bacterium]|jgi:hypothetical protein|nr:hypothetical protein [Pirellulales bacterium]